MQKVVLDSREATEQFARDFATKLKPGDFIAFYGDLGAGKTCFVRGMASVLCPTAQVSSPTYALVNEYDCGTYTLCHFDMYRITDEDDLESTGFWDYKNCIWAVEWAENIPFALPPHYYKITINKTPDDKRELTLEEI